jgi:hypothetical protein
MSRVLRPFLMFPRNGEPAFGSGEPGENLNEVIKDFRPAAVPAEEVKLEVAQEMVPKVSANPDSSATESASDSPDGDSEKSKTNTDPTQTPPATSSSPSASPEVPADAAKEKLQHPSSTTTGKTAPPAQV